VELSLDKCRSRIELATSGDALGALLGMAVMNRKDGELIDRLIEVHVLPQIPFADYEVLGYVSYAAGLLQPSQKMEVSRRDDVSRSTYFPGDGSTGGTI